MELVNSYHILLNLMKTANDSTNQLPLGLNGGESHYPDEDSYKQDGTGGMYNEIIYNLTATKQNKFMIWKTCAMFTQLYNNNTNRSVCSTKDT